MKQDKIWRCIEGCPKIVSLPFQFLKKKVECAQNGFLPNVFFLQNLKHHYELGLVHISVHYTDPYKTHRNPFCAMAIIALYFPKFSQNNSGIFLKLVLSTLQCTHTVLVIQH